MIVETYILYVLPLAARVALSYDTVAWTDLVLSQVSVPIVLPTTLLPRFVPDALREHVYRHAVYATAFTVAVLTAVRLERLDGPFLTFCALGIATLWWFVLSHWMQNAVDARMNTHQGDVSVLPLTLVAIATFVLRVPDDVFRFTRSTVFAVPVIVAWATMFFLAFQNFARQCITTHEHPAFSYYAYASLVIAAVHLLLIETNASAHAYQVFPIVAALFCQCIPDAAQRPEMRPRRRGATVACVVAISLGLFYAAMRLKMDEAWIFVSASVCAALVLPIVNGTRWVGPASLVAPLATWRLYSTDSLYDLAALAACHYVVFFATEVAVCPTLRRGRLPSGAVVEYDRVTCRARLLSSPSGGGACLSVSSARALRLVEEQRDGARRAATFAAWTVPGVRLFYEELDAAFRTYAEDADGAVVRATVA